MPRFKLHFKQIVDQKTPFRLLRTSMVGDQSLKFSTCHLFTKLLDISACPNLFFCIFQSCHTFAFALSSFALLISCVSKFTILCAKIFTSRCRTDIRRGLYVPYLPPPKRSMENMTGKLLKLKTNL